jgi:hypothetical protein
VGGEGARGNCARRAEESLQEGKGLGKQESLSTGGMYLRDCSVNTDPDPDPGLLVNQVYGDQQLKN